MGSTDASFHILGYHPYLFHIFMDFMSSVLSIRHRGLAWLNGSAVADGAPHGAASPRTWLCFAVQDLILVSWSSFHSRRLARASFRLR
jgi:hypothetical protein